jgi:hypothetical protein
MVWRRTSDFCVLIDSTYLVLGPVSSSNLIPNSKTCLGLLDNAVHDWVQDAFSVDDEKLKEDLLDD